MDEELKLPMTLSGGRSRRRRCGAARPAADFVDALAQLASFSREPRTMSEWNDIFGVHDPGACVLCKDDSRRMMDRGTLSLGRALFLLGKRTEI